MTDDTHGWRFEKSITLGSILTMAIMGAGAFTYSNAQEARMTRAEVQIENTDKSLKQTKRDFEISLTSSRQDVKERLDRIEDRLIDMQKTLSPRR